MLLAAHCELVWKYLHIGDIFALFILFAKICVIVIAACSVSLICFYRRLIPVREKKNSFERSLRRACIITRVAAPCRQAGQGKEKHQSHNLPC